MIQSKLINLISTPENVDSKDDGMYSSFSGTFRNQTYIHLCKSLTPIYISVPNLFNNITIHNNTMIISINGTVYTITIPPARYGATEVLTNIQTIVNGHIQTEQAKLAAPISSPFTITQLTTGYLQFSNTDPLVPMSIDTTVSSPLSSLLGLPRNVLYTVPLVPTTLPMLPNFLVPDKIMFHLDEHGERHSIRPQEENFDTIGIVHLGYIPYGGNITWEPTNIQSWKIDFASKRRDVHNISIRMTDGFNNPVFLPENAPVVIVMRAEIGDQ